MKVERADPLSFSKVIVVDQYLTNFRLNITTVKYTGSKNNALAVKITGESVYDPRRKEKVDDHISVYFYVGVTEGQVNDVKQDQNGQLVMTGYFNLLPNVKVAKSSNVGVIQKVLKTPFEWVVTFDNPNANPLSDLEFSPAYIDHLYEKYKQQFESDFDVKFPVFNFLKSSTMSPSSKISITSSEVSKEHYREFAMQVLSSLIYGLTLKEPVSLRI